MSRHRNRRSHPLPFRPHHAEALEPRTLLAVGPASLLKDINTLTESSEPAGFLELNGRTLFRADDGVHGAEWFFTDGTAAGTGLLRDFIPGWSDTRPDLVTGTTPVLLGGTMLFRALDPSTGYELWKTDGTPAGTTLVKDINPGPNSSFPGYLTVAGDVAYFTATDGVHGYEVWKSDGTEAGTQMVADLSTQTSSWDSPIALGALGDRLVFAGPGPDTDASKITLEPWVTDGTAAGTLRLANINPAGPSLPGLVGQQGPVDVAVSNGILYFAATGRFGRELWRTDGTPEGTTQVSLPVSPAGPRNLTEVGGSVYFTGGNPLYPPNTTSTHDVYRIDPVAGAVQLGQIGVRPDAIVGNVGGVFYILALDNGKLSLFKHDPASPTAAGLVLVKELGPAPEMTTWPGRIVDDDGAALFLAQAMGGEIGVRLWRSDGTAAGTKELARFDVPPDPNGVRFAPADPDTWILRRGGGGLFYFSEVDWDGGFEPYRTDGTVAGTHRLLDLNRDTLGSVDSGLVWVDGPAGGRGLFAAADSEHGEELWATDGTEAGTFLLKDIEPGPSGGLGGFLPGLQVTDPVNATSAAFNGRTYFQARTAATGAELWTSDGTADGTYMVKEIVPGPGDGEPVGFTPFNGRMYFRAKSGLGGVWVTDGTADGTRIAIPVGDGGWVLRMHAAGDWMYYWVRSPTGSIQMWKTDGTEGGNVLVKVIPAPVGNYDPILTLAGVLYFQVNDTSSRSSLWRSDGTSAGTTLVKAFTVHLRGVVRAGNKLLIAVGDGAAQRLWFSDGTPQGTVPAGQVVAALGSWQPAANGAFPMVKTTGNVACAFGQGPDGSIDLWRTDGTPQGTRKIATFQRPGRVLFQPLNVEDGQWYFRIVQDSIHWEFWRTDGTENGTILLKRIADLGPVAPTVEPNASLGGGRLFFNFNDGTHGTEMWSMPLQATTVAGRHVFYNNSAFDGHDPAATAADLSAIATDKAALLPGEAATFANVTSYDKGINGVLVDLAGAVDSALTADDFDFRVGRSDDPAGWALAPAPVSIVTVPSPVGAAVGRYAITWADGAIHDTWLRVTVRSNERTGLAAPDVFYFGNLVGEIGDDPTDGALRVTVRDMLAMRRRANLPAAVTSATDINRDGTFNAADLAIVRRNLLHGLPLLSTPAPVAAAVAQRAEPPRTSAARRGVLDVLQ